MAFRLPCAPGTLPLWETVNFFSRLQWPSCYVHVLKTSMLLLKSCQADLRKASGAWKWGLSAT